MTSIEGSIRNLFTTESSSVVDLSYPCDTFEVCAPYSFVLSSGNYTIELWGASGGNVTSMTGNTVLGGRGGYVRATLHLEHSQIVYVHIGAQGRNQAGSPYNGGGAGPSFTSPSQGLGSSGGGSTDLRLSEFTADRIAVAGGGGGACAFKEGIRGGDNLGKTGEDGLFISSGTASVLEATGATQEAGGIGFRSSDGTRLLSNDGALLHGGSLIADTGAGAGGGGLFGGGSGGWTGGAVASGAAGSSFANGCIGCAVMNNLLLLSDHELIKGNEEMPSPSGTVETGHRGDGHARITVDFGRIISLPSTAKLMKNINSKINNLIIMIIFM